MCSWATVHVYGKQKESQLKELARDASLAYSCIDDCPGPNYPLKNLCMRVWAIHCMRSCMWGNSIPSPRYPDDTGLFTLYNDNTECKESHFFGSTIGRRLIFYKNYTTYLHLFTQTVAIPIGLKTFASYWLKAILRIVGNYITWNLTPYYLRNYLRVAWKLFG